MNRKKKFKPLEFLKLIRENCNIFHYEFSPGTEIGDYYCFLATYLKNRFAWYTRKVGPKTQDQGPLSETHDPGPQYD